MSDESRVDELFLRVADLEPQERERILDEESADAETRRRVEQLLASDSQVPRDFLEGGERDEPGVQSGARIGPYHILERLGEGGMGAVYAARQSFPRRDVALKVLHAGHISESAIRRFRHEIEILGRLQHSGIARIYDAGVAEVSDVHGVGREVPYFTMELVRGVPLVRYAREHGLRLVQRLELLARVCDAVHYAHQRGVIHRDLKADNVFVTNEESTSGGEVRIDGALAVGQPKVLDFGIARVIDADVANATQHTVDGALIGTLSSMSPEQVSGERQLVDVRTDVYALGVLLYELICGRAPIALDGLTVIEAIRRITEVNPDPPGELDPELRGDLTTITLKALEKDPERHYQTAIELANDLRAFLHGEPIQARADSRLYVLRRSLRRHRLAVGAAVAFAALLGVFGVVSVWQARESAALASSEAEARRIATADFERALGAIELLTELGSERLVAIPQADSARRELLEAAADFYRELLAAHPEAEWLDHREAVGRYRMAVIERELGNLDRALVEATEAKDAFERQLDTGPVEGRADPSQARRGLALSLTLIGNLLYRSGEVEKAEEHLRRAVEQSAELLRGDENDSDRVVAFSTSHKHLAIVLYSRGETQEALEALATAAEELERALSGSTAPALESHLVGVLQQATVLHLEAGRKDLVERDCLRAIELCEQLLEAQPDQPRHRLDLAGIRSNYSVALERAGRREEQVEQLDLSILLGEELLEEHPALERSREGLFSAYNNRASHRMSSGDLGGADADMTRAAELLEERLARAPSVDGTARLAMLENNQAAVQIHLERPAEALETLERATEHATQVLAELPERVDLQVLIRYARSNLALCHADLGRHVEAVALIRQVEYTADGYSSVQEVTGVLNVWQKAVIAVGADEDLTVERRSELASSYLEGAASYLEGARTAGFAELEALAASADWSTLRTHPALEEVLRGGGDSTEPPR